MLLLVVKLSRYFSRVFDGLGDWKCSDVTGQSALMLEGGSSSVHELTRELCLGLAAYTLSKSGNVPIVEPALKGPENRRSREYSTLVRPTSRHSVRSMLLAATRLVTRFRRMREIVAAGPLTEDTLLEARSSGIAGCLQRSRKCYCTLSGSPQIYTRKPTD
ncbi:hypothetical protein DPMN_129350 [Dreissena polymorpha]|uniref:Uncharacterized protein n=1 Tax=Dreissena polymorpha TaxID=45954 RepID=A0A9D4H4R0_DREPO|nr:hypothetical protein DPMN_129350 [Dreissena polymorpha]